MRRSTIPVVLLALLSFAAGVGRGAITDTDEAFYAESAREMVESGNWLTPYFNYEPRFQKPAFYYWVTAALFAAAEPHEFLARAFAAAAGVGLVLITTACARRWYDESVGLLAGAIAATSFGYFALARMSLPDLPLAFFITCSIWTAFVATLERERNARKWLLYAALAAALGFLVKGPLAVLLPVLVVVPILLMERRSLNVHFADMVLATVLFLAVALPWYLAMWMQHGTEYLVGFFVGDNFERFATDRFNDPRPWWFYLPVVAGGLMPWTPLAVTTWIGPVVQFSTLRRDIGTLDLRLLLWAALPLLFFTLSIGKQPRYILPVLPPLAILLAGSIIERTREWRSLDGARRRPRPNGAVVAGCALGGLVLVGLAVLLYRARPMFLNLSELNTLVVAGIIAFAGVAVIIVSLTGAWRSAPGMLAVSTAITFALLPYGVLSAAEDSTVVQMAERVRSVYRHGDAIGTYQVFVRNLVFYSGLKHTDIIHDEHLTDWLDKNPRALLVMHASDADRLQNAGLRMQRLGELPYFNDGAIRLRMLLWPDPASDLDRVVLVRIDPSATASRD